MFTRETQRKLLHPLLQLVHNPMGRPSLVSKFPTIVSVATSFIKANGYSVHEHRREEVGKVGVSLQEIKEHILSTVPGLRSHGIGVCSVARPMQPPPWYNIQLKMYGTN